MKVVIVQKYADDLEKLRSALSAFVGEISQFSMELVIFTQSPEVALRLSREAKANSESILIVSGLVFEGPIYSGERLVKLTKQVNPDAFMWAYSSLLYRGDPSDFVVTAQKHKVSFERMAEMIAVFTALGTELATENLRKFAPLFL